MINKHLKIAFVLLSAVSTLLAGCLARSEPTKVPVAARQSTPPPAVVSEATATSTPRPAATSTPQPTATDAPVGVSVPAVSGYQEGFTEAGDPFKGDPAAPVLLEEFSSYQCPFCKRYFQETFSQIVTSYVEAGLVRYVFRDYPLASQPQSSLAAGAANCAGQAGGGSAYWAMHDLLFERQTEWSGRSSAGDLFRGYAGELSLDTAAFGECLDAEATRNQVQADLREGTARGVRGTPTFFIDGQPLVGAQPYNVIAQAIDAALAQEVSGDVTLKLAPASALPPEVRQLPPEVQEAYRFALANPDVLEVIPCYCGCNQVGHENNRMCYVQSETADGRVVFDSHAAT
jgi:protein-disulfide isomerase